MIGVVLAGGASTRLGGRPKGLIELGGRAMALIVADTLAGLCSRVVIEAPRGAGYEALGLPVIHAPREHAGKGPLAALAAGFAVAAVDDIVAFAPCDMPFLTRDIYDALARACEMARGAYAVSPKGEEPLVAVLGAQVRHALATALASEALPRTHRVLDAAGARRVPFANGAAFANVNTPEDLAAAAARFASTV